MTMGLRLPSEVNFNLRRACKDCPFRRSTPHHEGVASDLENLYGQIERGGFLHSCHKTDPRSDGYVEGYKGPVSHCAGAMTLIKNMGPEHFQGSMLKREVRRYMDKLKPDPDIFNSFLEMVEHYVPFIKNMVKDQKEEE
jgi:hypothetical protein